MKQNFLVAGAPTKASILRATTIALAVALILLVTTVLPAEYGIDPLRVGRLLNLTGISQSGEAAAGKAIPASSGIYTLQPTAYKVDTEDGGLHPGQGFEIKYHMQKGASLVFAWKADGPLNFEFHGEPDQKPKPNYFESYLLNNKGGKSEFYGSFIAPTTGVHGWFWENKTKQDIRMRVSVSGFFDYAKMYAGGEPEELMTKDPLKDPE